MWLIGAASVLASAAVLSSPGTLTTIVWPGLNPSLALYGAASMWTPCALAGIAAVLRFTRLPVGLLLSRTV
jgi:hypothetical protein